MILEYLADGCSKVLFVDFAKLIPQGSMFLLKIEWQMELDDVAD